MKYRFSSCLCSQKVSRGVLNIHFELNLAELILSNQKQYYSDFSAFRATTLYNYNYPYKGGIKTKGILEITERVDEQTNKECREQERQWDNEVYPETGGSA
jgi:hypothetical protein